MISQTKSAQYFLNQELTNAGFKVTRNKSGRRGVDFIINTKSGNKYELYLESHRYDKHRSIKISKAALGGLKDNLWIALVLFSGKEVVGLFLIPSKTFETPDDYIFIDNPQSEILTEFANWEIKVFKNGLPKLNEYQFVIQVENLI